MTTEAAVEKAAAVEAVANTVQPPTIQQIIASLFRHSATGGGGVLIGFAVAQASAHGWATPEQTQAIIGGIISLVAVAWSTYQKMQAKDALKAAIASPAGKAV